MQVTCHMSRQVSDNDGQYTRSASCTLRVQCAGTLPYMRAAVQPYLPLVRCMIRYIRHTFAAVGQVSVSAVFSPTDCRPAAVHSETPANILGSVPASRFSSMPCAAHQGPASPTRMLHKMAAVGGA